MTSVRAEEEGEEDSIFNLDFSQWENFGNWEIAIKIPVSTSDTNKLLLIANALITNNGNDKSHEFTDRGFEPSGDEKQDFLSMDFTRKQCAEKILNFILLQINRNENEAKDDTLRKNCEDLLKKCWQCKRDIVKMQLPSPSREEIGSSSKNLIRKNLEKRETQMPEAQEN